MKSALTKRVLDMLEKMAKNEPENYSKFWSAFGNVLKEGQLKIFLTRKKLQSC